MKTRSDEAARVDLKARMLGVLRDDAQLRQEFLATTV
jgi:hypothetical protein